MQTENALKIMNWTESAFLLELGFWFPCISYTVTPKPGRTRRSMIPRDSEVPLKRPVMLSSFYRSDQAPELHRDEVCPDGDQDRPGENPDEVQVWAITRDTSSAGNSHWFHFVTKKAVCWSEFLQFRKLELYTILLSPEIYSSLMTTVHFLRYKYFKFLKEFNSASQKDP